MGIERALSAAATAAAAALVTGTGVVAQVLPGPTEPPSVGATQAPGSSNDAPSPHDAKDVEFMTDAIRTDLGEIQLAELAEQRSQNPAVREYAGRLRADHARMLQQTAALLAPLGVELPAEPSATAQQRYQELEPLSGEAFDAAFAEHMVDAHRQAIEAWGTQTHANPNEALSSHAEETLALLRAHLAAAESLPRGEATQSRADPHLRVEPSLPAGRTREN